MIMSLTDHAHRVNGAIVSRPIVGRLVEAQRKAALMSGCAFFDTFQAMGGAGAVALGRKLKPPLAAPDLRHPTRAGQRKIGTLLYAALMRGYGDYRRRQVGRPLPVFPAPETPLGPPVAPGPQARAPSSEDTPPSEAPALSEAAPKAAPPAAVPRAATEGPTTRP